MRRALAALLSAALVAGSVAPAALAAGSSTSSSAAQSAAAAAAAARSALTGAGTSPSPLAPGLPQSQASLPSSTTPSLLTTTTSAGGSSGLSGGTAVGIGIGALVVITLVGLYIWRDARKHARRGRHAGTARATPERIPGSKRPPKKRQLSAREKQRRKRGRAR